MRRELNRDALKLFRVACTAGVLVLGGLAFFLTSQPDHEPAGPEQQTTLRLVFSGIAMVSLIGIPLLRRLLSSSADAQRIAALLVIGWALGEAPALFGGTAYLLTGDPLLYVVGVAILFLSFLLLPIPEPT